MTHRPSRPSPWPFLAVVAFASVSVLVVDRYHFGLDRHAVIVPFLKHLLDPVLYPADYLIAEQAHYYTFLWKALSGLMPAVPWSIETIFFILYCIFTGLLFLAVYLVSQALFRNTTAAVFALFLLLFANVKTLGSAYLIHQALIEKTVALPILLFAFFFFLKGRLVPSAIALGTGFLIHPLTGVYVAAMLGVASILELLSVTPGGQKPRAFLAPVGIFVLMALPMLVWRLGSSPESASLFRADAEWLSILRVRSAHHVFPMEWSFGSFLEMGAILLAGAVGASQRPYVVGLGESTGPDAGRHRMVLASFFTLMLLWLAGTLFSEGQPLPVVIQLQLFRSSSFVLLFAILYLADLLAFAVSPHGPFWVKILGIVGALAFLHHSFGARFAWVILALLVLGAEVAGIVVRRRERAARRAPRRRKEREQPWRAEVPVDRFQRVFNVALVVAALGMGSLFYWVRDGTTHSPILENASAYTWREVQSWARENTVAGALFIVPPNVFGFRTESERTIYGDWKDGTQTFFNPSFGTEWMRRMRRLGYDDSMGIRSFENLELLRGAYEGLDEEDFLEMDQEMAADHPQSYVVMFRFQGSAGDRELERLDFPVAFENEGFVAYEVRLDSEGTL